MTDGASSASRPGAPWSRERVLSIVEETLRENWVEGERDGVPYAYTPPSPGHYPWQWYWDSCFTGLVWRRFDKGRAEAELRSLIAAQREDGFIGHTIFWDRPVDWRRRWRYNVAARRASMTETIQPPLLAWAWRIAVGDPSREPSIKAHHDWLSANRDLDGDGLLWIFQPDESGLDASPKFDAVWGRRAHHRAGFPLLVRSNRRLGFDARRIADAGGPVVCEVTVNVLWCLARLALGQPSITPALVERLWDAERGLFLEPVRRGPGAADDERVNVSTWSALAPLALPDLPEEIGHRLVREHLLDERRYWTPVPAPSVSVEEPSFEPRRWRVPQRVYWRGPSWINSAWLIWIGLLRLGYEAEAKVMVDALAGAVERERLREFYEPFSGEGLGAIEFGWSSLIAEMVEPEPGAAASYL